MLILTRKTGQAVMIGDDIDICILDVRGSQVRIGINAPRDIEVYREEIYHKIQQQDEAQAE